MAQLRHRLHNVHHRPRSDELAAAPGATTAVSGERRCIRRPHPLAACAGVKKARKCSLPSRFITPATNSDVHVFERHGHIVESLIPSIDVGNANAARRFSPSVLHHTLLKASAAEQARMFLSMY